MKFKRIFVIVLDSLGAGEASDAKSFGDIGANTLGRILNNTKTQFNNLEKMGCISLINNETVKQPISYYTKAKPISNGKDTLTGHLEMMGIYTKKPFKTFTKNGFPASLLKALEQESGHKIIGNCSESGTEIIERLGKTHMETQALIVYTSSDSVLQIAAHEDIISIDELYHICQLARKLTLKNKWKVGRIIARPFIGEPGNFKRTANRHDYALNPVSNTVLDNLKKNDYDVIGIGKIADIFNNCGITKSITITDNIDGMHNIVKESKKDFTGLCFANLNDFDSLYGHRRDIDGYAKAIKEFDDYLPTILNSINHNDLLIITADHGNDPGFEGSDHTRENVPVLFYANDLKKPKRLKDLETLGDIGATIADNFIITKPLIGNSLLDKLQ
ncbi:MAG: phosphopentomutase [Bacilli bacterium]